jgi:hypothetical protein
MAKFIVIKEKPSTLESNETVIEFPNFKDEISGAMRFVAAGPRKLTTRNFLSAIVNNIIMEYETDPLFIVNIPYSRYEGVEFKDEKDLNEKVLNRLLTAHYPSIFDKYLEKKIKSRPTTVDTVFFIGPEQATKIFITNGLDKAQRNEKKK